MRNSRAEDAAEAQERGATYTEKRREITKTMGVKEGDGGVSTATENKQTRL